jgi:hypothetical protein
MLNSALFARGLIDMITAMEFAIVMRVILMMAYSIRIVSNATINARAV